MLPPQPIWLYTGAMKFSPALPAVLISLAATGCSAPHMDPPSLAPRSAEAIDPRVPVSRALIERPVGILLRARLAQYLSDARAGDAAFRAALGPAQRAAAAAGPGRSESWIAAQQALSALEAARAATPKALSNIDAMAGADIKAQGGIGAEDLAAIEAAAAEAGALDTRQRREIAALSARIG